MLAALQGKMEAVIFLTANFSPSRCATIEWAVSSSGMSILVSFFFVSLAVNGGGDLPSRCAVIDQYS